MWNVNTLIQVKAFARIDGALLALLWTLSFVALLYMPQTILGTLLMLATPLMVTWRLIKFRNYALDGFISYRRALAHCCYQFFYASLLFAVVQFAYFQFLDGGHFVAMLRKTMSVLEPMYQQNGISMTDINATMSMMEAMSPIEKAFSFMMQNLMFGLFLSLLTAAIGARRQR